MRVYSPSLKKYFIALLFISLLLFLSCFFILSKSGSFDVVIFQIFLGLEVFVAVLLYLLGYSMVLMVSDNEVVRGLSIFRYRVPVFDMKIVTGDIKEVRFGIPKNNNIQTFGAINIYDGNKEISFNPDLFESQTLSGMFNDLKRVNTNISFDKYASNLMVYKSDRGVFRKMVAKNFMWIAILTLLVASAMVLVSYLDVFRNKPVYIIFGIILFALPFTYNFFSRK